MMKQKQLRHVLAFSSLSAMKPALRKRHVHGVDFVSFHSLSTLYNTRSKSALACSLFLKPRTYWRRLPYVRYVAWQRDKGLGGKVEVLLRRMDGGCKAMM